MDNKKSMLLNEAQKRSLSTSLRLLEERIHFIELLLSHGSYHGILLNLEVDLNNGKIKELQTLLLKIRNDLKEFKRCFDLKEKTLTLNSVLNSTATYFWTVIEDERPKKLKRYGRVHSSLSKVLSPLLDELISNLIELASVTNRIDK